MWCAVKTTIIHLALANDCSLEEDGSAAAPDLDVQKTLSGLIGGGTDCWTSAAEQSALLVTAHDVQTRVFAADVLHTYFAKPRFYSRHYPITDTRARMVRTPALLPQIGLVASDQPGCFAIWVQ